MFKKELVVPFVQGLQMVVVVLKAVCGCGVLWISSYMFPRDKQWFKGTGAKKFCF